MQQIIKADRRHFADFGWLRSHWLFSFSDYYDPENEDFGVLHVFNDEFVEPGTGYPFHPHHEMEIVTIVLEGEITHEDTLGNELVVRAGEVQRMSAGSGVAHSEYNLGTTPVHLFQIWITPSVAGLEPEYAERKIDWEAARNRLQPIIAGDGVADAITIHQDATIYLGELDPTTIVEHHEMPGRRTFLYVMSGEILLNSETLGEGDQLRAMGEEVISFQAGTHARVLLIDLP